MGLMNALISEFAERQGLDPASAAAFLGDIGIRDYVLKFNEVLEKYAADVLREEFEGLAGLLRY